MLRRGRLLLAGVGFTLTLAACGFKLRDSWALPYESLYLEIPVQSEFGAQLKRSLRGAGATRVADRADDAAAIFLPTSEARERKVITYNSSGRAREVQLTYRYSFRLLDRERRDLIAPASIVMTRDMTYDEASALAKTAEEELIWRDMMSDLAQRIMRQLAGTPRAKPGDAVRVPAGTS